MNIYRQTTLKTVKNYKEPYAITELCARVAKEIFYTKSSQE